LVAIAMSLEGSKKNNELVHTHPYFTIPTNFVKIGPVDVDIIGLTKIVKIFFKNRNSSIS